MGDSSWNNSEAVCKVFLETARNILIIANIWKYI